MYYITVIVLQYNPYNVCSDQNCSYLKQVSYVRFIFFIEDISLCLKYINKNKIYM
jgi:hypothetical protein